MKRLDQQRKELLEKVFIEQIRKQKELEAEQYYQQQNQLMQLQRLHQLKLLQEEQLQLTRRSLGGAAAGGGGGGLGTPTITLSSGEEPQIPTPK